MKKLILLLSILLSPVSGISQTYSTGAEFKASFSGAIRQVSPAVVNIFTQKLIRKRMTHPLLDDPFFNKFFGGVFGHTERKQIANSLGSGVIVTPDGYFITNNHVIEEADAMQVILQDGRQLQAEFVNADPSMDIAIMKLQLKEGETVPHVSFGNSDALQVGDVVLAIGNPFGVGQSVSMGIVSALGRANLEVNPYANFIQTDAAINPGNSGGALIDSLGRVVGINTAIFSQSGASHGIGFAIPAKAVQRVLTSVLTTGKIARPWLGASGQDLTGELAMQLGLKSPNGVLINEIDKKSPAQKGGLKMGDVVLQFDGIPVRNTGQLAGHIRSAPLETEIPVQIWRGGEFKRIYIKLEALPDRDPEDQEVLKGTHPMSGYVVEQLSATLNHELKFPLDKKGVVVISPPLNNRYVRISMQPGDVILSVNGEDIQTIRQLNRELKRKPKSWTIVYERGNSKYRVVIR